MAILRAARLLALALVMALGLACTLAYFALGVTPGFLVGLVEDALNPSAGLSGINVPASLQAAVWADGLESPTSLAFGPDGRLYVAQVSGLVLALTDGDEDGRAETRQEYARFNSPLGLTFHGTDLYIGRRGGVALARDTDGDGAADSLQEIVSGLPATRHQTNGLAFGPDGQLYIAQGSTSDRGESGIQPLEASILVADPDGANLQVFASGLRNPFDLAFYPSQRRCSPPTTGAMCRPEGCPMNLT